MHWMQAKQPQRNLRVEHLEARRVLSASVGWDGPGAGSASLTYHVADAAPGLTLGDTKAAIESALDAWSAAADISFEEAHAPGQRDSIDIRFGRIDGPGGTLAQAYFPDDINPAIIAGDILFDIADQWEVGNIRGGAAFDLVYVAVHELGHSLGLDHIHELSSVLAPTTNAHVAFEGLSAADIAAIQQLYAPSPSLTPAISLSPESSTTAPVDGPPIDAHNDPQAQSPAHEHDHSDLPVEPSDPAQRDVPSIGLPVPGAFFGPALVIRIWSPFAREPSTPSEEGLPSLLPAPTESIRVVWATPFGFGWHSSWQVRVVDTDSTGANSAESLPENSGLRSQQFQSVHSEQPEDQSQRVSRHASRNVHQTDGLTIVEVEQPLRRRSLMSRSFTRWIRWAGRTP